MSERPARVFLDTNVYIIGAAIADSDEAAILNWAGFDGSKASEIEVEIFLAAREGEVDCFVSANRELVRAAAAETGAFVCLTPEEFVARFLS